MAKPTFGQAGESGRTFWSVCACLLFYQNGKAPDHFGVSGEFVSVLDLEQR